MSSSKKFTDLFIAYNANISNLYYARQEFENELKYFIQMITDKLDEANSKKRTCCDENKLRWGKPEEWTIGKDSSWIRSYFGVRLPIDIRPPTNHTKFRNNAGYLYLVIRFDEDFGKFMLRCRFENNNYASEDIDEKIIELIKNNSDSEYPFLNYKLVKNDEAVLFKLDLEDSLFETIDMYIEKSLTVCEQAIDELFPDCDYMKSA